MKHEVHILLGCADARDLSQLQVDTISETVRNFGLNGIQVDYYVLRVAGSFVTPDVIMDIKRTVEQSQRESWGKFEDSSYFVHIQTHGHLDDQSNKNYISHLYEMNVVPGSPLNCGMMEATTVGIEIEKLLLNHKPLIHTPRGDFRVESDVEIRRLLKEIYAHEGYLAGDWIKSIDKLRTHPRLQKANLERAIKRDPDLSRLGITITAGILDYSIHGLIRLDGGIPEVPFWDQAQNEIRKRAKTHISELSGQSELQKPNAGLISMTDPRRTSRLAAARHYFIQKGMDHGSQYLPNTIFHLTGSGYDLPESPFGPYAIGGFYYAVKNLGLTDWIVLGYEAAQTARIHQKIINDPIMKLIIDTHGVNLIVLNQVDLD